MFVHSDGVLLCDAWSSDMCGSILLVSSICGIIPGNIYLVASENACPMLSFV